MSSSDSSSPVLKIFEDSCFNYLHGNSQGPFSSVRGRTHLVAVQAYEIATELLDHKNELVHSRTISKHLILLHTKLLLSVNMSIC